MFAVIRTGGKQYRVTEGQTLDVEKLEGKPGDKVMIEDILMVDGKLGAPTVKGASVTAEIMAQGKGEKVLIFKKKRRHNYRRKRGHRQHLTTLKITGIKT